MLKEVVVPDIGSFSNVEIIEILVKINDTIAKDASILTLETDKATMEIPSPFAGVVKSLDVKIGDKVSMGDRIVTLEVTENVGNVEMSDKEPKTPAEKPLGREEISVDKTVKIGKTIDKADETTVQTLNRSSEKIEGMIHAGPGVRRFARELGVDLSRVQGSGRKERILQQDVQNYVKNELKRAQSGTLGGGGLGLNLPPWPQIDHAQFGLIRKEPLNRIKKLSGSYLHRNWLMVPHVTQFDEADITDLEKFRKDSQTLAEEGVKLTPLVFIMKALIPALQSYPNFNASLDANGSDLIYKKYFHIGVAVDTINGLVVPVVRDVDKKGLFQLAKELAEVSQKARKGLLTAQDMQGSSFSISSLGGIGGTAFTPIINVPDVAILGVSKSQVKPIYLEGEFKPRLMLPLSLSYDHRVIDGAEAARFSTCLVKQLSDIRRLLL